MGKFICGLLLFIWVSVAVFGSGTEVGDTAMEWLCDGFIWGVIALVVLKVINLILSMFQ